MFNVILSDVYHNSPWEIPDIDRYFYFISLYLFVSNQSKSVSLMYDCIVDIKQNKSPPNNPEKHQSSLH
jgi:hypothetical protein